MSVKRRTTNASSLLLNADENETLFNILGRGCMTLASGVCQLYTADAPTTHKWSKRFCGVVCFVKDNPKRSYYIRLYDIKKDALIWEQEIYNQFKYKAPREYFHTFEADSVQAGLNFASEDEAIKFKNAVEQKLLERHQKKLERKRQQTTVHHAPQSSQPRATSPMTNTAPAQQAPPMVNLDVKSGSGTVGKSKGKKDKKKKLTKEDISTPTAFRHVSHVGWDPTKGFDMNNLDSDMKSIFEQVGITNATDVDKETVDFIYDFVEQHGGIQKVKEEMKKKPPPTPGHSSGPPMPPPPARSAGPPPAPPSRAGPPPPPSRSTQPPPPPSRSAQPPPTPARTMGSPPTPPSFSAPVPPPQSAKAPPPPAPAPGVPPPPPPPAVPAAPPPPPAAPFAPPAPLGAPSSGAGRGALMDSIRAGAALKHNTEDNRSSGGSGGDARSNLMDAIRSGKQLKAVEKEDRPDAEQGQEGGIVGALAMALANRQKQLQISDDEDDDDELDDEDEWDD